MGMILIGVALAAVSTISVRDARRERGTKEESNRLRQIGLALFEFQMEYGSFPDERTADVVRRETGTWLPLGTKTSNDFFRQLIASGIAPEEIMFHAKIAVSMPKPDNVIDGFKALERGECGYTYLGRGLRMNRPDRPIVVTPMIPGTDRFDPEPFSGKAMVLKLDNSVGTLPIDENGHAVLQGRNMMDPDHPIWGGFAPVIAWPDL